MLCKYGDQIVLFKCIVDFVHALREMFGEKQHSLELYDLLLDKTGLIHQEPIKKHIQIFHHFVLQNENAILNLLLGSHWAPLVLPWRPQGTTKGPPF